MWYSTAECIVMLTLSLLAAPLAAEAPQPKHVPRLGFSPRARLNATSPGSWVCSKGWSRWAMWRGPTSSSSGGMRQGGCQAPRPSSGPSPSAGRCPHREGCPGGSGCQRGDAHAPHRHGQRGRSCGDRAGGQPRAPRGNITGLSDFNAGVIAKRLELLKDVVPAASHIAVLLNPANPTNPLQWHLPRPQPALRVTLFAWGPQALTISSGPCRDAPGAPGALLVFEARCWVRTDTNRRARGPGPTPSHTAPGTGRGGGGSWNEHS